MRKSLFPLLVLLTVAASLPFILRDKKEESQLSVNSSAKPFSAAAAPLTLAKAFRPASPAVIRTVSGGALFEQLFPVERWQQWPVREVLKAANARFRRPYPVAKQAHLSSARDLEILDRVGILKALGRGMKSPEADTFFRSIARNPKEPLLVRRQALENLRPALARMSERARAATLKDLPPLLLSLAAQSEREILRQIWGHKAERQTAAAGEGGSLNLWENLPCPSAEEFQKLARGVNWQGSEDYVCDLSMLGKLGRSLLLLSKLSLSFPGESPLAANLAKPYEFLAKRSRALKLDLYQKDTIAYNRPALAEINLGPIFFADSPLDSLNVLIHEARHSDREEQGHTVCIQGDIPQMPGGCDFDFTDQEHAGAYSYGVFYALGLAQSAFVSPADREYLESAALAQTSTRFNKLLPAFARFQDVIAGLDADGKLKVLHPFASRSLSPLNETFQRIAYEDKTGGLYLLDGKSSGFSWQLGRAPNPFYPSLVAEGTAVRFIGKFRQHYHQYPHTSFLDDRNKIYFLDFDSETGERRAYPHPLPVPGRVNSFFSAAVNMSLLLTEEGGIFRLRQWGNDKDYNPLHESSGPYRQGSGGILKDTLFLVGADGRLHRQEEEEVFRPGSSSDTGEIQYSLRLSPFAAPLPAKQYEEGTGLRALLDEAGDLWVSGLGSETPTSHLGGLKLKSFAIMKAMETSLVQSSARDLSAFQKNCGVKAAVVDPWLSRGAGLADGRLLFEGENGACWPADLAGDVQGKIVSFAFESGPFGGQGDPAFYFAPTRLVLILDDGRKEMISPYLAR